MGGGVGKGRAHGDGVVVSTVASPAVSHGGFSGEHK